MGAEKNEQKQSGSAEDLAVTTSEADKLELDSNDEMEDLVESIEEKERSMKKEEQ